MRLKILLILPLLMIYACERSTSPEPVQVELTTSVEPDESGSVNPEGGIFEEGTEVELLAVPAEDWVFVNWKGDISSEENPVTITLNQSMQLTAEFEMQSEEFYKAITVKDRHSRTELIFGMDPDATDEYEEGLDRFAPPTPPAGAFFAHFAIGGENFLNDFRSVSSETTIWNLEFAPEEGGSITLEWNDAVTSHVGTLVLTDDPADPSIEINMKAQSSYEVPDDQSEILFIISN